MKTANPFTRSAQEIDAELEAKALEYARRGSSVNVHAYVRGAWKVEYAALQAAYNQLLADKEEAEGALAPCPRCHGDGMYEPEGYGRTVMCPPCNGTGLVSVEDLP
jgi:cytochrome c553